MPICPRGHFSRFDPKVPHFSNKDPRVISIDVRFQYKKLKKAKSQVQIKFQKNYTLPALRSGGILPPAVPSTLQAGVCDSRRSRQVGRLARLGSLGKHFAAV